MKKIFCFLLVSLSAYYTSAQFNSMENIGMRIQAIWQNDADSNNILVITGDSLATHEMKLTPENRIVLDYTFVNITRYINRVKIDSMHYHEDHATYSADSIYNRAAKLKRDPSCSYKLDNVPDRNDTKFKAATGVYMLENYKGKMVCCAIDVASYSMLKMTYPDGKQASYHIVADLLH